MYYSITTTAKTALALTATIAFQSVCIGQEITDTNGVSQWTATPDQYTGVNKIDFINAQPHTLPIAPNLTNQSVEINAIRAMAADKAINDSALGSLSGVTVENQGSGKLATENLGEPGNQTINSNSTFTPADFGTAGLAFSTSRADLVPSPTNEQFPFRASGKLFFKIGGSSYICSGSMIDKGVVATAAHCVSKFGQNKYFDGFAFVPGYRNGIAPYGSWEAVEAYTLTSYLNGTDSCDITSAPNGVVCENDVAVLVLKPKTDNNGNKYYVGENTGWYSYGWNQAGFTSNGLTHITQIGYPGCLDNGAMMQRNDAQASINSSASNNSVFGSLMCGGSSGGGVIANFGNSPTLTGTVLGQSPLTNLLIGTTSWGSTNSMVKQQGSSPFLETNILALHHAACNAHPEVCN